MFLQGETFVDGRERVAVAASGVPICSDQRRAGLDCHLHHRTMPGLKRVEQRSFGACRQTREARVVLRGAAARDGGRIGARV
jgi:hypothetical protein